MGNQRSCRCKFKTKFILEVPNMFKAIWLWMWEVDRVIFCPVAWSIPFSSGMGLPLLIISRLDWKSSFENCFSLAIKSSIPQKCRRRATFPSITPTGALSHAPFIEAEVLCASPTWFFNAFWAQLKGSTHAHACAKPSLERLRNPRWGTASLAPIDNTWCLTWPHVPCFLPSIWIGHAQIQRIQRFWL